MPIFLWYIPPCLTAINKSSEPFSISRLSIDKQSASFGFSAIFCITSRRFCSIVFSERLPLSEYPSLAAFSSGSGMSGEVMILTLPSFITKSNKSSPNSRYMLALKYPTALLYLIECFRQGLYKSLIILSSSVLYSAFSFTIVRSLIIYPTILSFDDYSAIFLL